MGDGMRIKDVTKTYLLSKKKLPSNQLYTKWGEEIDPDHILEEYPRPQLKRDEFTSLNGYWDYAITKNEIKPSKFQGKILVPFSPESVLSGVNASVMPEDFLWYERVLPIEKLLNNKRCLLHFGAVDQYCEIFINDKMVKKHMGGYLPFSVDLTEVILEGENKLTLKVIDYSDTSYHNRGKQKIMRGGMFYTAQSGIWQTVWMEWVPDQYIKSLKITPLYDENTLRLKVNLYPGLSSQEEVKIKVDILANGQLLQSYTSTKIQMRIPLNELIPWSPENPFLYDMVITVGEDRVESYFAMRKYEVKKDEEGVSRIFLNNKPYFHNGVLDQGYWPDGLYTSPSDEAIVYDIQTMKQLGFNMIRKHIKIEPLRWYYHCDRLGMIVWQDMVNGGEKYNMVFLGYLPTLFPKLVMNIKDSWYFLFARANKKGREEWIYESRKTVEHLYNCPSIAVWVPFNEGWGQFDSAKAVDMIRKLDPTRLIDQASGWFDQRGGDFKSIHNYFRKLEVNLENRPVVLTEFAGYACYIPKHSYSATLYGYRIYKDRKALNKAIQDLYHNEIQELISKGLSAAVFTQLADVEDEVNGLLTYDRKVCKITKVEIPELNKDV
jgi:hypothetical protein